MLGPSKRQIGLLRDPTSTSALDGHRHSNPNCVTEEQLLAFVQGQLGRHDVALIDNHLNACAGCCALLVEALHVCDERTPERRRVSERCWAFEANARVADRYVVRRPLGHGGMGEVYEAFDLELGQTIALKTALATHCDQRDETRRLFAEFKLARRVCDRNVCRVYDVGVHQDVHTDGAELAFLSMEVIEGESLARRLRLGNLTPEQVQLIGRELFLGLLAIHRVGVIHRDIKSHNVMLRQNGPSRLAIVDFGLAIDAERQPSLESLSRERSNSFSLEGSPAYMAPEQFQGACITPATDVFACGVVLFEALTGTLPFRSLRPEKRGARRDPQEVALRATDIARTVSKPFDDFIARCLELDPTQRYATAGEALGNLERSMKP